MSASHPSACNATFREATCDRARGHLGDHCAATDADGTLTWDDDCARLSQASLPYKTAPTIQGRLGVSSVRGPLVLDDSAAPSVEAREACPFTHEDVRLLRDEIGGVGFSEYDKVLALAARIASLLPPEKT